jgi:aminoethylphosphonate catabolism LysR family transcriptional regulator
MFKYHKQLRSFHAVAREGGFTAAADYLNIGQPTVTEQVSDLEERFGVELFFRRGRGVVLTPVGEQLHEVTRGMFNHEEEAMQLLRGLNQHQTGILRVGSVSPPIAVELLGKAAEASPELKIDLSLSSETETLARLYDFKIDIGIVAIAPQDPHLHTVLYESRPIVAIMRRDHALAGKDSISLKELAREPLVLREAGSKTRQIVEQAALKEGVELKARLEINSREAILHAVCRGFGVGFITDTEFFALPELCAVPLKKGKLRIDYFLCCLTSRKRRPAIEAILKMKKD